MLLQKWTFQWVRFSCETYFLEWTKGIFKSSRLLWAPLFCGYPFCKDSNCPFSRIARELSFYSEAGSSSLGDRDCVYCVCNCVCVCVNCACVCETERGKESKWPLVLELEMTYLKNFLDLIVDFIWIALEQRGTFFFFFFNFIDFLGVHATFLDNVYYSCKFNVTYWKGSRLAMLWNYPSNIGNVKLFRSKAANRIQRMRLIGILNYVSFQRQVLVPLEKWSQLHSASLTELCRPRECAALYH